MSLIKILIMVSLLILFWFGTKWLTRRIEESTEKQKEALGRFWSAAGRIENRIDDVPMPVLHALTALAATFDHKASRAAFAQKLDHGYEKSEGLDISEITLEDHADFEAAVLAMTDALAARFPRRWKGRAVQARINTSPAVQVALRLGEEKHHVTG